jgi:hypothetical protein
VPALALQVPVLQHGFQFFAYAGDLVLDQPAVRFQLAFSGTAGADAAAQPGQRHALAGQARQKVKQLGQFHLQLAFDAAGAAGKNIKDQAAAVDHLDRQQVLQVPLLQGAQHIEKNDQVGPG